MQLTSNYPETATRYLCGNELSLISSLFLHLTLPPPLCRLLFCIFIQKGVVCFLSVRRRRARGGSRTQRSRKKRVFHKDKALNTDPLRWREASPRSAGESATHDHHRWSWRRNRALFNEDQKLHPLALFHLINSINPLQKLASVMEDERLAASSYCRFNCNAAKRFLSILSSLAALLAVMRKTTGETSAATLNLQEKLKSLNAMVGNECNLVLLQSLLWKQKRIINRKDQETVEAWILSTSLKN